jgi:protein phosphatase
MPEIDFCELTQAGSDRAVNADAVGHWPLDDGLVFAVADGVGDGEAAEVASSLALDVLALELAAADARLPVLKRLRQAIQTANMELYQKAITVPELEGMATTLTATAVTGSGLITAHVGDCRLWLLRDRILTQITKDHTWVWAHLPGVATAEQRHGHPRRYSLPRCLGHELVVTIDLISMDVRPGDVLVHTSDGLHGALSERDLERGLAEPAPRDACSALLNRAREQAGDDDSSVQVAVVRGMSAPAARRAWWRLGG